MEIWSKGLGARKLNLRIGEGTVKDCGHSMVVKGKMGAPVWWDYSITMTDEDIRDILQVAAQRGTIDFLFGAEKRTSIYFTGVKQVTKIVLKLGAVFVKRLGRRKKSPSTLPPQVSANKEMQEAKSE